MDSSGGVLYYTSFNAFYHVGSLAEQLAAYKNLAPQADSE